jgi:hypothetical protein
LTGVSLLHHEQEIIVIYDQKKIKRVIETLIRNNGKEQHHALPQYSMEEFNEPIGID